MEIGFKIAVALQVILRILLRPVFWLRSMKTRRAIPKIGDPALALSATVLASKIRNKELTSTQVVTAYIKRVKEVNPIINAVVEDRFADALKDAEDVDRVISENTTEDFKSTRPLLGVPLTVKESCALKGLSFSVGSKKRPGFKAPDDGEAVKRLKKAGAIPILVSNTPELCAGWESANLVTGTTLNPYNTNATSGGSSGGEGALLASGASVIGIGSDVAGSIRLPAMFNGVFGHKPTPKVIPIEGHWPTSSDELIADYLAVGPLTRYAEDLTLMMDVMADKSNLRLDQKVNFDQMNVYFTSGPIDVEIKSAMRESVEHLKARGAKVCVKRFEMESTCQMSISLYFNTLRDVPNVIDSTSGDERRRNLYVEIAKKFLGCSDYSSHGLFFYWLIKSNVFIPRGNFEGYRTKAEDLRREFLRCLGDNGVFLYPTFPTAAFQHYEIFTSTTAIAYTMVFNVLGFPSTHVPLGINAKGLPIGIQVVAAPYQDRLCLAVAEELENRFGGWKEP